MNAKLLEKQIIGGLALASGIRSWVESDAVVRDGVDDEGADGCRSRGTGGREGIAMDVTAILGQELVAVEFVQDFVQLRFEGPLFTLYAWPHVLLKRLLCCLWGAGVSECFVRTDSDKRSPRLRLKRATG